jgi:hypothetical protein
MLGAMMFQRIPAGPPPAVARPVAGCSTSAKLPWLIGLALTCLLLAGCAGAGGSSTLASGEDPRPKPDPVQAQAAAAGPEAALAEAVSADPVVLKRRRQAIAQMLEGNVAFRGILLEREAPKISDAKLAGPFERRQRKNLFSSEIITRTLYCATAGVGIGFLPRVWRTALIEVNKGINGSERLVATIDLKYYPPECGGAKFEPFPELEQVRAQRRRSLGMTD